MLYEMTWNMSACYMSTDILRLFKTRTQEAKNKQKEKEKIKKRKKIQKKERKYEETKTKTKLKHRMPYYKVNIRAASQEPV